MTVSIPKPNWRAVQTIGERLGAAFTRVTHSAPTAEHDTAKSNEWSTVMSGSAGSSAEAAHSAAPAPARIAATARARSVRSTARRQRPELSSAWLLPSMLLVICLVATGWLFAHGTAAAVWLVALIGVALAGVPLALVVLRLFGYEDPD